MDQPIFKKGNLVFLPTILIDLLYIVDRQEGEVVRCRKLDAPPTQFESIPSHKLVKLAEEQELILPFEVGSAIERQRQITFANVKKKSPSPKKKATPLGELQKMLKKSSFEDILLLLAEGEIEEEEPSID